MAEPKFEKDLEKLEGIVGALEDGGLSLDDSLKKFEEGVKLYKRCHKALTAPDKKIESLTKDADGKIVTEPFNEEEAAGEKKPAEDEKKPAPAKKKPAKDDSEQDDSMELPF